ncbi:hypothetical protein GF402_11195 [Candidatus Fermentibacteria bacterium]|nr:hypothetical protein [Candidatus Fermentibacteria bacterium]
MRTMILICSAAAVFISFALAQDFPQSQADTLIAMMEAGKPQWVISFVRGFEPAQRLRLYHFAREVFLFEPWEGKDLDDLVTIANAGIEEAMAQAKEAPRVAEVIKAFVDQANIMSYNLSADLADCWPGDTLVRYRRHFERGLSAALQCVEWRIELEKGPYPLYSAYWAAGMHQLSLGRYQQALYTLNQALNHAQQHTIDSGLPLGLCPEAGFDLILAHGYLGVALVMCGDTDDQYELAMEAFEEGIEQFPDRADDYRFGMEQLRRVRARIIGE